MARQELLLLADLDICVALFCGAFEPTDPEPDLVPMLGLGASDGTCCDMLRCFFLKRKHFHQGEAHSEMQYSYWGLFYVCDMVWHDMI